MEALIPNEYWAFLFLALGLILMFFEVFIPSGGILGVVAAAVIGLGIYGMFLHDRPVLGIASIIASVATCAGMIVFALKRLRLETVQDSREFTSVDASIESLAGKSGTAETPLRPAGVARIDGRRVDVVAATGFIEKDTPVRVVETSGNRVVVRILPAAEETQEAQAEA